MLCINKYRYILAGRLYQSRPTLFLACQNTRVYASGHYDTMPPGIERGSVYSHDHLCSFRWWPVIDPATAVTIGELGLRGRSHRARGRRAGARVQCRIKALSRGVNSKPRHSRDPLQPQPLVASIHRTGSCLFSLNSPPTARQNNMTPRTQRHTHPTVRRLKCGTFNIRSMRTKIDEVDNIMRDRQLHVLAVTETWHEDAECITIKRLRCLGFNVIEAARPASL